MSIAAMTVSTVNNPDKLINFVYNRGIWVNNFSVDHLDFNSPEKLIEYLKKKYDKVHFFRINMARTFNGNYVKPKDLYKDDMNCDAEPNCIMIRDNDGYKLLTTKARRAKEFVAFNSTAKNIYVPVMLYKDSNKNIKLINFK